MSRLQIFIFRFAAWWMIVIGSLGAILSLVPSTPDWPWGSLFFLICPAVGFMILRALRWLLNDPDYKNMTASRDR
jgi:hypothetical protein